MKTLLICFLVSITMYCDASTSLGIGLVSIKIDSSNHLYFYKTPGVSLPIRRIEFFDDKIINGWNIVDVEKNKKWMSAEELDMEIPIIIFRCKSKRNGWLQVIVNNETGKSFWIKDDTNATYLSWETYLKEWPVGKNTPQKIRVSPSDYSKEVFYTGNNYFGVKSMKEDWIEIFSLDNGNDYTEASSKVSSGWIRWRNGNNLLVGICTKD